MEPISQIYIQAANKCMWVSHWAESSVSLLLRLGSRGEGCEQLCLLCRHVQCHGWVSMAWRRVVVGDACNSVSTPPLPAASYLCGAFLILKSGSYLVPICTTSVPSLVPPPHCALFVLEIKHGILIKL